MSPRNFAFREIPSPDAGLLEVVIAGLNQEPKRLPCSLLYDEAGSRLFDAICDTDEYYITRTEVALLERHGPQIAEWIGPASVVVELGAGNLQKARLLLQHFPSPVTYVPVDISKEHLRQSALEFAEALNHVKVQAICADFHQADAIRSVLPLEGRRVLFFPGSTIGNLEPDEALQFLRQSQQILGNKGMVLVGVDLKKDASILNAAYNDAAGITALFETNILVRLKRELGAALDPQSFVYKGFYNEPLGRVEMYLVSLREQTVRIGPRQFPFKTGERIHLENSYKYSVSEFQALAAKAGLLPLDTWVDADRLFSLHLLECQAPR
jgi:dimethylhistidine N-methyltransferase